MRCVAIIMVRNGERYVDSCLSHLARNHIEFAIIDHSSTDNTYELCLNYKDKGLCHLSSIDYEGDFIWGEILDAKMAVAEKIKADWIIHYDIDECMDSSIKYKTLYSEIEVADFNGYTAINFNEFVFIPQINQHFSKSRYYYFYSPNFPRLMRAWKKSAGLKQEFAGHALTGGVSLYPVTLALRHYIFLDQQHAFQKYSERPFCKTEVEKGWHKNRVNIDKSKLAFPVTERLKLLPSAASKCFDTSDPWKKHFWV